MAEVRKFAFAASFDAPPAANLVRDPFEAGTDHRRTEEDFIRQEAFDAGRQQGRREAENEGTAAVAALGRQLAMALEEADRQIAALAADAAQLALAAAERVQPPIGPLVPRLESIFADAAEAPRIRIRVAARARNAAETAALVAADNSDFAGRVTVETAPDPGTGRSGDRLAHRRPVRHPGRAARITAAGGRQAFRE